MRLAFAILLATTAATAEAGPLVGRADLVFHDAAKRDRIAWVLVDEWLEKPVAGTYALLDEQGLVARLALHADRTRDRRGCPFHIELTVDGTAARIPANHVVVVGPVTATGKPRLLRHGLATTMGTGPEEPLGVAGPRGIAATFAVDLDGDDAADLLVATVRSITHPRPKQREIHDEHVVWRRDGGWTQAARCAWTAQDFPD